MNLAFQSMGYTSPFLKRECRLFLGVEVVTVVRSLKVVGYLSLEIFNSVFQDYKIIIEWPMLLKDHLLHLL